jgi:hypothetical protein
MPKLKFHNATRQKRITSSYKGIAVGDDFNAIQLGQHFPGARIKVGAPQIPGVTAENLRYRYCVDSVNGNDSNPGTQSQPFATIAKLLEQPITEGDKIGLAKGSVWREQLTIGANNITVEAYGTGNAPLIDCSDAIPNASFTKTDGRTNVYQYEAATNYVNEESWINVWEDGAFLTNVASLAACDAAPGSYYVASHITATPTIYIHPTASTNPISDGKLYEFSARSYGIGARGRDYIKVTGVHSRRNYNTGGSIVTGAYARLIDCRASEGNKHNIYTSPGSYHENCLADEAYYGGLGSTLFILHQSVGNGAGAIYNNCTASLTTYDATNQGFSGHISTSGTLGTVTFNNCTITNVSQAFSLLLGATVVNYNNCALTGCARGWTISYGTQHNISGGSYTYTTGAKVILSNNTALEINIDGLAITYASSHATGGIELAKDGSTLNITNCTWLDNNAAAAGYFILSTNALTFTASGNNFRSPNLATAGIYIYRLIGGGTYTSDYNTFSKNNFYYSLGSADSYTTLAAYRTAKNQDLNSVVG